MSKQNFELIFVAGGGARVEKSSVMYTFMRRYADTNGVPYSCVDGTHEDADDGLTVSPASYQLNLVRERLAAAEAPKVLIVTQCLGTVASLAALEESFDKGRRVKMLTISPSLPSPATTLAQPRSIQKRVTGQMETWDLNPDTLSLDKDDMTLRVAKIPDAYLGEHIASSKGFQDRLRTMNEMGLAAICRTDNDWNLGSFEASAELRKNVMTFTDTGHSLNPSYKDKRMLPYGRVLEIQKINSEKALRFGFDLMSSD